MTKRYYTVDGRIIGESTGGVRTDYVHDAQGNVVATTDETGAVVNTYRYKPFGNLLATTGAGADPRFLWNGAQGTMATGMSVPSHYAPGGWYASSLAYTFKGGEAAATLDVKDCGKEIFELQGFGQAYGDKPWWYKGCGDYGWCTQWVVKGLQGKRAVIVQCIDKTYDVESCKSCKPLPDCEPKVDLHFCEYWEVGTDGKVCVGDCANDPVKNLPPFDILGTVDFFNDSKDYSNCKGSHKAIGVAKLFFWDDLPKDWEKEFKRPPQTGNTIHLRLPERPGGPPGWFGGKSLSTKTKTVDCPGINCCPPENRFSCTKNVK